jgi:hypothetical protein
VVVRSRVLPVFGAEDPLKSRASRALHERTVNGPGRRFTVCPQDCTSRLNDIRTVLTSTSSEVGYGGDRMRCHRHWFDYYTYDTPSKGRNTGHTYNVVEAMLPYLDEFSTKKHHNIRSRSMNRFEASIGVHPCCTQTLLILPGTGKARCWGRLVHPCTILYHKGYLHTFPYL